MTAKKKGWLSSRIFDSRIKSANVQKSEQWLGFFASPTLIYMAYYCLAGTYLNQFYVDVVKLGGIAGGAFLVLLPVLSKIFDAITNIVMGQIIDRTRTAQGKVRPWILISAPLVAISGILLYQIPQSSTMVQAIWVAISYNLYFAFSFTIYNMSQSVLLPMSTRNVKQRDGLAMTLSMGQSMLPGAVIYMIFPMVALPYLGLSASRWATVMSIISIFVLPATLLQYYFTKERVSEGALQADVKPLSFMEQIKTCIHDKYWLYYFAIFFFYNFQQSLYNNATVFYSNWVLGSYNDGITLTLINAVGQAPLGLGVFLLWPLVKKVGKRRVFFTGMLMAAAANVLIMLFPTNLAGVLGALMLKSFGMLPTYLFMSMMADVMDHIEWKNGCRCDGLTASINSVMVTIMAGIATGIFNAGLSTTGYMAPVEVNGVIQTVTQNASAQNFIVWCFAGIPAVCFVIVAVFGYFFDVDKLIPQASKDIAARYRAAAEARGEVYVSPEELAAAEQEENDRIAEAKRIEELKAKCAKKGLSFEAEEAKYQEKLAAKQAKKAKKNK